MARRKGKEKIMDIQKEIEISRHQPTVFIADTELGELFEAMVERKNLKICPLMASIFYILGRVHGIRQERARRKATQRQMAFSKK